MELTCPECCFDTLRKTRGNRWNCKVCGTSFDFDKLRNALDKLVGREFTEDFIDELLGNAQPERTSELGERAWRWVGKHGILDTLDMGNTRHVVMKGMKSGRRSK